MFEVVQFMIGYKNFEKAYVPVAFGHTRRYDSE